MGGEREGSAWGERRKALTKWKDPRSLLPGREAGEGGADATTQMARLGRGPGSRRLNPGTHPRGASMSLAGDSHPRALQIVKSAPSSSLTGYSLAERQS